MALRPLEEIVPIDRPYIPPYAYIYLTEGSLEGERKTIKEGFDRAAFIRKGMKYGYDILKRTFAEIDLPENGLEARSLLENPYCGIPVFIRIGRKNPKTPEWMTRYLLMGWGTAIQVTNWGNQIHVKVLTPAYEDLGKKLLEIIRESEKANPRPAPLQMYPAREPNISFAYK